MSAWSKSADDRDVLTDDTGRIVMTVFPVGAAWSAIGDLRCATYPTRDAAIADSDKRMDERTFTHELIALADSDSPPEMAATGAQPGLGESQSFPEGTPNV